ncbi:MAG: HAD-IIA family hydrolase [Candidatus Micrarchaeota archaeon]
MGFKAAIIDLDGVLVLGEATVPGAPEAVKRLRQAGLKLRFLTNNATRSKRMLKKYLSENGLLVEEEELMSSASCAATYLNEKFGKGRVFIIGEEGLAEELDRAGFDLVADDVAEFVVVGLDRRFTYDKLTIALRALKRGARFIATNEDATLPTESGPLPGAGSMVASLVWASQKKPDVVVGKPYLLMFEQALKELGTKAEETLLVGDRLETDILGGNDMGLYTVMVLTGASSKEDAEKAEPDYKPKLILKSIAELPEKLETL